MDSTLLNVLVSKIEQGPIGDPLRSLVLLGKIVERSDEAGRLEEFRPRFVRALISLGKRVHVEALISDLDC